MDIRARKLQIREYRIGHGAVVVLPGVDQYLIDALGFKSVNAPREIRCAIVLANRGENRRGFHEVGSGSDDDENFHIASCAMSGLPFVRECVQHPSQFVRTALAQHMQAGPGFGVFAATNQILGNRHAAALPGAMHRQTTFAAASSIFTASSLSGIQPRPL